MQHDHVLKKLNFDFLTPRVWWERGGGSEGLRFASKLLQLWLPLILSVTCPCSEKVNFDLSPRAMGEGYACKIFAIMLLRI